MARPINTYAMYKARIFSKSDIFLISYIGTLPTVRIECEKHFLAFDSTNAIRRHLDKTGVYAKGYQSVNNLSLDAEPAFVHISPDAL